MISITIRPRVENFDPGWREKLVDYYGGKGGGFIFALESGGENKTSPNHIQGGIKSSSRTDNIRRQIISLLKYKPKDDDESKLWLDIKKHKDPKYLVGYCCKEGNYASDLSEEYIQECIQYYDAEKNKLSHKFNPTWKSQSLNSLFPAVYDFCVENNLLSKHIKLKKLLYTMFSFDLLPLSLVKKITVEDNRLWYMYKMTKWRKLDVNETLSLYRVYEE